MIFNHNNVADLNNPKLRDWVSSGEEKKSCLLCDKDGKHLFQHYDGYDRYRWYMVCDDHREMLCGSAHLCH